MRRVKLHTFYSDDGRQIKSTMAEMLERSGKNHAGSLREPTGFPMDGARWRKDEPPRAPKQIKRSISNDKWKEEMRTAKNVDIYSEEGEVVNIKVAEFCLNNNMTESQRKKLYGKTGWKDTDDIHWRVGELPEFKREIINSSAQVLLNFMEADIYFWYCTGVDRNNLEQAKQYVKTIKRYWITNESNFMTNAWEWLNGESNGVHIKADTYERPHTTYGKRGASHWTGDHSIHYLIDQIEEQWVKQGVDIPWEVKRCAPDYVYQPSHFAPIRPLVKGDV